MLKENSSLTLGALLGGLGVALGAFGAHALKTTLLAHNRMDTFELAVRYQFYHALALLLVGFLFGRFQSRFLSWAATLLFYGTVIFSGSLYLLSLTGVNGLGAVTPVGGVLLLAGWAMLLVSVSGKK